MYEGIYLTGVQPVGNWKDQHLHVMIFALGVTRYMGVLGIPLYHFLLTAIVQVVM